MNPFRNTIELITFDDTMQNLPKITFCIGFHRYFDLTMQNKAVQKDIQFLPASVKNGSSYA